MTRNKLITIILLIFNTIALSEEPIEEVFLNTNFNLGLNLFSADISDIPGSESCCDKFSSGIGFHNSLNINLLYKLAPDVFALGGLSYFNLSGNLIRKEETVFNTDGTNAISGIIEHRASQSIHTLGMNLGAAYRTGDFLISMNYGLGIPIVNTFEQSEQIIKPQSGVVFDENDSKIFTQASGDFPITALLHSFATNFSVRLPMNNKGDLHLVPNAFLSLGLNSLISDSSLFAHNFGVGLGIEFDLSSTFTSKETNEINIKEEEILLKESLASLSENKVKDTTKVQEVKKLESNIILRPVYVAGKKEIQSNIMELEEFNSTRTIPLLNYIFFDHNSFELHDRYFKLEKSEIQNFKGKDLFTLPTLKIYQHILNIIGERLRNSFRDADININAYTSNYAEEENNKYLAVSRANTIKNYFTDIWQIDEDRIKISGGGLPPNPAKGDLSVSYEENRRVELNSNNSELLKPLEMSDTLLVPKFEKFKFYNFVDTTQIKYVRWEFIITKNGSQIHRQSEYGLPPIAIEWTPEEINKNTYSEDDDISYTLELYDEANKSAVISGKIIVSIKTLNKKTVENMNDKLIEKISLILFDYDKFDLEGRNLQIVEQIENKLKPNSKVIISGFTDNIGNEDYNKELSMRRADAIYNALSKGIKEKHAYGESIELFNNRLPEGRFYSRTVLIDIETPIEKK